MKLKLKPKQAVKHAGRLMQKNSPTILSAVAVAGVAATAYLTCKATWKGAKKIEDVESVERMRGEGRERTPMEKSLLIWKLYIPAVAAGVGTMGCIVLSNRIQARRAAAVLAAYGVLSGDFDEYRNKAAEMLGVKKTDELDTKLATEKMEKTPTPAAMLGVPFEDGRSWFCDLNSMRYFISDRQTIEKARNDFNHALNQEQYMTLNEMYELMDLEGTDLGKQLGWKADQRVEVNFTPVLMPSGVAATAFKFHPKPSPDFDDLH